MSTQPGPSAGLSGGRVIKVHGWPDRAVSTVGASVGLTYNVDQVRRTTTFRAHQLLHLAGDPAHGGASRRHSAVLESLIHGAKKQQFFVDALRLQAAA